MRPIDRQFIEFIMSGNEDGAIALVNAGAFFPKKSDGNEKNVIESYEVSRMFKKDGYHRLKDVLIEESFKYGVDEAYRLILLYIKSGDVEHTKKMIEAGIDVNQRIKTHDEYLETEIGETILFCAIKHERKEIFDLLLEKGADVNIYNAYGKYPLYYATGEIRKKLKYKCKCKKEEEDIEEVKKYEKIENTCEEYLDIVKNKDKNADAKIDDYEKLIEESIEQIDSSNKIYYEEDSSLYRALTLFLYRKFQASEGKDLVKIVKKILDKGFVVGWPDVVFYHRGLQDKIFDLIKLYIEHGVDVNSVVERGWHGEPTLGGLREYGRDRFFMRGCNAICFASENKALIEFLLNNGADINAKCSNGKTALFYAVKRNDIKMTKFLIEQGANVNVKALMFNVSPLSQVKSEEMVDLLLENGATGVKEALWQIRDRDVVSYLLDKINISHDQLYECFMFGVERNRIGIVNMLMEKYKLPLRKDFMIDFVINKGVCIEKDMLEYFVKSRWIDVSMCPFVLANDTSKQERKFLKITSSRKANFQKWWGKNEKFGLFGVLVYMLKLVLGSFSARRRFFTMLEIGRYLNCIEWLLENYEEMQALVSKKMFAFDKRGRIKTSENGEVVLSDDTIKKLLVESTDFLMKIKGVFDKQDLKDLKKQKKYFENIPNEL